MIYGLADKLLSMESPTRSKFVFLMCLAPKTSATKLLLRCPQLPTDLLSVMGNQALASHVSGPAIELP